MKDLSLKEMLLISHSLGVDLFKAVISTKQKDKKLPKEFYRNYFNAGKTHSDIEHISKLISDGFMETRQENYYYVTDLGISKFTNQFNEMAFYKPKSEMSIDYLKHRINFYCSFYNYNFCEDNSDHILNTFQNYWLKKLRVSHTTEDVIRRFQSELKQFFKPSKVVIGDS